VAAESSPLSISVAEDGDGVRVVALTGELDFLSASDLGARLSDLRGQTGNAVVIDVSGLTFIDSTGLNVLVAGVQAIQATSSVVVAGASKHVSRVFEIVRLDETVRVESTIENAMRAAREGRG
jgi:stage II sporulation protein AA (anti-sigma F factor antagonist)